MTPKIPRPYLLVVVVVVVIVFDSDYDNDNDNDNDSIYGLTDFRLTLPPDRFA